MIQWPKFLWGWLALQIVAAGVLWASAVVASEAVASEAVDSSQQLAEDTRPLIRIGITPWQKSQSVDEMREQYRPLLAWLGDQIGYHLMIVGGRSYEDTIELIADGSVQLAVLSPVPYAQAKRKNPALELIGTELKWNESRTALTDSYRGFIISRKDRADIVTIADLKGKQLGFVNEESTSGWRYPNALLLTAGIDVRRMATVYFLGSHPRVTDALVAGSIDAGATWDYNLAEAVRKHGDAFKVILRTPPIPNICLVAHASLPPALCARIRTLLTTAPAERFAKTPMQGYVERPDSFYDVVRTLIDSDAILTGNVPGSAP